MINRWTGIGRLVKDPENRYTPNGVSVTTFTIAINRQYTNAQGKKEADFIPIVTWRGLADNCAKYLLKGRLVAVTGRIQTRSYETQEGDKRYITEIVADEVQFLESAKEKQKEESQGDLPEGFLPADDDEDLPF